MDKERFVIPYWFTRKLITRLVVSARIQRGGIPRNHYPESDD